MVTSQRCFASMMTGTHRAPLLIGERCARCVSAPRCRCVSVRAWCVRGARRCVPVLEQTVRVGACTVRIYPRLGRPKVLTQAPNLVRPHDISRRDSITTSDELAKLASEVRRLRPDWRDAEAFYEQRSEICGALMRLSRGFAREPVSVRSPVQVPKPQVTAPVASIPAAIPVRSRRVLTQHHRFPRPPRLPPSVQPQLL